MTTATASTTTTASTREAIHHGSVALTAPTQAWLRKWLLHAWARPEAVDLLFAVLRLWPETACWLVEHEAGSGSARIARRRAGKRWRFEIEWRWEQLPSWRDEA